MLHAKTQSIRYTIPTLSTYVSMRRLSSSDIQCQPYLHMLPWEDSVNQIYKTDPIYICYHQKTQSIRYTIPTLSTYVTKRRLSRSDIQFRPYLPMFQWEDSVHQIYNNHPIYISYQEKTQAIRYTMPTISTYVTMRRLSQSDIQDRPYLHMLPWEDSVNQIYNTDPIYICYHEKTQSIRYTIPTLSTYITHEKTQSIRYTIPTLSTYVTMRRLNQSDIQYRPYLHMLPREDSVNPIYNTDPIYICYHEKTQSIRYTIPTLSTYITHEKTQSIRYTIPTLSTYFTMRRLSRSDIQHRYYLYMLPKEDSVDQIYNTTLSTYVTLGWPSWSDVQYRPYQHMVPWEDSVDQEGNAGPIYICHDAKTQSIRYTILTLSTYASMIRLSRSDIQYDSIYICYQEKTQSIRYTIPTLSTYITHEKTQSIRYTIPTLSTYVTKRRLSRSDIQYRPYLHMLPREDSVDQIYNTNHIYIYFHEKTQSIRYTINPLSTYITIRRLSRSGIQYRPYLNKLPWEDSVDQLYNYRPYLHILPWEDSVDQIYNYRPYLHTLPCEDSVDQIYNTDPIYMLPWEDSVDQI